MSDKPAYKETILICPDCLCNLRVTTSTTTGEIVIYEKVEKEKKKHART